MFVSYPSHPSRLVLSVEVPTSNLKVVGSSPTEGKNFSFCIYSLSTLSSQVDSTHTNEVKHDIRPRQYVYRENVNLKKKYRGGTRTFLCTEYTVV